MNNYKILNFKNFDKIKKELQIIAPPYVAKGVTFVYTDLKPIYEIDCLWEELKEFGATKNDLQFAAVIVAKEIFGPHKDTGPPTRGLNFPLENCEGTSLVFYNDAPLEQSIEYKTLDGGVYYEYEPSQLTEIERVTYVNEAIVFNALKIHDIHGAKSRAPRVTFSLRFSDNITFGLE
jgi:hypothetical protein